MANPALRAESMNVVTRHPKIKVTLTLAEPYFIAGNLITSQAQSANPIFILIQGHDIPPSHAVLPYPPLPSADDSSLRLNYYTAQRGHSTFLFRLPLHITSPSSFLFGNGLAEVRYEVPASVRLSSCTQESFCEKNTGQRYGDEVLFNGPEYVIPPGVEGIGSLMFDEPSWRGWQKSLGEGQVIYMGRFGCWRARAAAVGSVKDE
ncbi:hypothetical protein GYMLUDRAFT_251205 [Collybiopsis luxurians FD-317 M1]|uniref:Uncharacterized protein n=1 Tax=Collybiopsis luxurians FD-317 M1 TaxID=944289 RepID=A0A0D0BSD7_9AGAR|nr:hypothetical protein GYMLUDRAFT_251205 [Collybiopsis luxurians FD-317 M1]